MNSGNREEKKERKIITDEKRNKRVKKEEKKGEEKWEKKKKEIQWGERKRIPDGKIEGDWNKGRKWKRREKQRWTGEDRER